MQGLIVLGGARCVWEDLRELAGEEAPQDHGWRVLAVNDAGYTYQGRLDYWASLHPENLAGWRGKRSGNADYEVFTHRWDKRQAGDERIVPEDPHFRGGSSGLYGVQLGLLTLEAPRIVLCGVPLDAGPHFFSAVRWHGGPGAHKPAWLRCQNTLRERVRSMSGWTRQLLGAPEADWLAGR